MAAAGSGNGRRSGWLISPNSRRRHLPSTAEEPCLQPFGRRLAGVSRLGREP